MAYPFDTNVFLRLAGRNDPQRPAVLQSLRRLRASNEVPCYTPQVLSEFWSVCTRPISARGGMGLSVAETERKARLIERYFRLLPDNLTTFQEWRRLVWEHSLKGVAVHDAKLVASMKAYGVTHPLTFNGGDFAKNADIIVVSPGV